MWFKANLGLSRAKMHAGWGMGVRDVGLSGGTVCSDILMNGIFISLGL